MLQLRTGGSLLAIDADEYSMTPRWGQTTAAVPASSSSADTVKEDHYHALFDCCKPPLKGRREQWSKSMHKALKSWNVGLQSQLRWLEVDTDLCVPIALGVVVPE